MTRSPLAEWPLPAFQLNNSFTVVDYSQEAEQLFGNPVRFFDLLDEGSRSKAERLLKTRGSKKPVELNFITAAGFFLADVYYRWDSDFSLNLVLVPKDEQMAAITAQLIRLRGRLKETDYELLKEKERSDALLEKVRELSAPCIAIGAGYVLIPLFGNLDAKKVEAIRPHIVTRIYEYAAETVVVDLTAMGTVAQEGVSYLESLVQTLGVMGIDAVITGVKPEHAQKLHLLKREMNLRFEASLESVLTTASENH
ncbi:STAS domain-containing protein [Planococcus alpniumensis]|uniref:STAS domain-containing protein n=1 Tax=Planococcus alpniumensis TaxID=2708345 RepID=UPI001B8D21EC|nr:STAS domain-containing protein [Planococcus sp. MSAK28401]